MTGAAPGWVPGGSSAEAGPPPPPWSPPTPVRPDLPRQVSALLNRHRRPLAALTAAVAVLAVVSALRPAPTRTRLVLVAAHDLSAGRVLTSGDLVPAPFPDRLVPSGALSTPGDVVGHLLTAPLPHGEPLTAAALAAPLPAGLLAVPLRFADVALVTLLFPGRRLDVYAGPPDGAAHRVAADVTAVSVLPGSDSDPGTLVLVAAAPAAAAALAAAAGDRLTAVLRP